MTWRDKFFKTLELNYSPKKHDFDFLYFLKEKFIPSEIIDPKISDISIHSIELTLEYLDIDFNYKKSSAYHQSFDKKGTERIISLVKENQGTQYINLPGGKEIYTHSFFATNNLELNFIDITPTAKNINGEFQHSSIIDTIMLLGKNKPKS